MSERKSYIAEVTGCLPFAGKHFVKYLFQRGREASKSGDLDGKIVNALALGGFAAIHAAQFKMGLSEITDGNKQNPILETVDYVFTSANALATYTQVYLGAKVLTTTVEASVDFAVASDGSATNTNERNERREINMGLATPTELAVTLGGSALFIATMG